MGLEKRVKTKKMVVKVGNKLKNTPNIINMDKVKTHIQDLNLNNKGKEIISSNINKMKQIDTKNMKKTLLKQGKNSSENLKKTVPHMMWFMNNYSFHIGILAFLIVVLTVNLKLVSIDSNLLESDYKNTQEELKNSHLTRKDDLQNILLLENDVDRLSSLIETEAKQKLEEQEIIAKDQKVNAHYFEKEQQNRQKELEEQIKALEIDKQEDNIKALEQERTDLELQLQGEGENE